MDVPETLRATCPLQIGPMSWTSTLNPVGKGVLAYARVSTTEKGQADGVGIENQIDHAITWASQRGLPIKAIAYDLGISGGAANRPGFDHLFSHAVRGDIIYVNSITRFSRDSVLAHVYIGKMRDKGIFIASPEVDTSRGDSDSFMLGILIQVSEWERTAIKRRVKSGMAKRKAIAGELWGTQERYGYRWRLPEGGGGLVPYEPEHTVVQALCSYYRDGHSVADCVKRATELWPERSWSSGTMSTLLRKEGVTMRQRGRPTKQNYLSTSIPPHAETEPEMCETPEENDDTGDACDCVHEDEHAAPTDVVGRSTECNSEGVLRPWVGCVCVRAGRKRVGCGSNGASAGAHASPCPSGG